MSADNTPKLNLPYILPSQAQKHVTHNEAIRALDALVQLSVIDRTHDAPPPSPVEGDRHIVAIPAAPGVWTGQGGRIAAWQDGAWAFYAPRAGWLAWVENENALLVHDGSAWTAAGSSQGSSFSSLGVGGATADTTNRLAVSAPATLLTHSGADHQVKVNKSVAANTASLLFQTGFSGRAEMGTAGNDDFSIKVSADGTTWNNGLVVDRATGALQAPSGLSANGSAVWTAATFDPASKAAVSHTHTIANVTGLQAALDAKLDDNQASAFALTLLDDADAATARTTLGLGTAATQAGTAFAAASHTHTIANVTGLQAALDAKLDDTQASAFGLTLLDDADAPTARTTLGLGTAATQASGAFAAANHTHNAAQVSDFTEAVDNRVAALLVAGTNVTLSYNDATNTLTVNAAGGGGTAAWGGITGTLSAQTDLQAALDAKQVTLVSGSTIKTVNGNSLLGSGDLVIAGGGGGASLGLHDWWFEQLFAHSNAVQGPFLGTAISTGTNSTAPAAAGMFGYNPFGVLLRSSTTANSGWRYQPGTLTNDYFGVQSHKFRARIQPVTAHTNNTIRLGYLDTITSADATDGAYFEIVAGTAVAKTANNSARTAQGSLALTINTVYTFEIDVNAAGTSARFRIWQGTNTAAVFDQTIATNIPTTSARAFGVGIVATNSGTVASDICVVYSMGAGTVEGHTRARG